MYENVTEKPIHLQLTWAHFIKLQVLGHKWNIEAKQVKFLSNKLLELPKKYIEHWSKLSPIDYNS
jgi:hypothetical protein